MCGIAGVVGGGRESLAAVRRMTGTLEHRGPDAGRVTRFGECVLGHRRLRVVDLAPAGDQPMANEDGTVQVVFNGEIYNFPELRDRLERQGHTFVSRTDTEVLVHLYEERGADMLRDLRGMFAFAIWDARRRELLLARDRLGIKPLYLRAGERGALAFASEVRALAAAGDALDPVAVTGLLRLGWVPGPRTIYQDVTELPPGHLLRWRDGVSTTSRWWSPPVATPGNAPSREELGAALADSVARQLVAAVPVGVFLSAGLDSLAVATLAAQAAGNVRAYTVAFDEGADEGDEAAAWAAKLGVDHSVIRIGGDDVVAALPSVVDALDQPSVDGVNSWVISRAVREAGLVVALSGLGGDELFGGYSTFRHVPRLHRLPGALAVAPARVAARVPRLALGRAARAAEAVALGGWEPAYAGVRGLLPWHAIDALWPGRPPVSDRDLVTLDPAGGDAVTGLELANYLPSQLLRDTDAMSMAHSIEVRVPLIDDPVVEAALRLPGGERSRKPLLAAAVSPDLVPVATAPKRTFTLPFDRWLRHDLAEPAHAALVALADAPGLGFDRAALLGLWSSFQGGEAGWRSLWGVAMLGMWLDQRRPGAATGAA